MTRRKHAQPRSTSGPRIPSGASLLPELYREVNREAGYYGISKSWVSAVAHAKFFGIAIPPEADYRNQPWTDRKRKRRTR